MKYVEEREFNLRLVVRCDFPEGYEGDLDGYAWADEMPRITAELTRAAAAALGGRAGFRLRTENRGLPTEDEITFVLEKILPPDTRS